MDYDKYFTKHQALLHLLAESPIVESVQSLTYKTVKIYFSEALNDEHIPPTSRLLFFLRQVSTATLVLSTVSDRNAYQALEWAKLDIKWACTQQSQACYFHRSKSLLGGFLQHGNQESIS